MLSKIILEVKHCVVPKCEEVEPDGFTSTYQFIDDSSAARMQHTMRVERSGSRHAASEQFVNDNEYEKYFSSQHIFAV